MKRFFSGIAIVFAVTLSSALWAGPQCQKYSSKVMKKSVRFCVERAHPEHGDVKQPVVYFMHGLGGGAGDWELHEYSKALQALAKDPKFPDITFVSYDTAWNSFFTDHRGATEGWYAYESGFVKDLIPYVEKTFHVCSDRNCRGVMGVSMGGLGSIKTAFRHPDLFSVVTGNSAALGPFNAHAPDKDWEDYFNRHEVGSSKGMQLLAQFRWILPTKEASDENDPAVLAGRLNVKALPMAIYFDVGGKDYFGFNEGYERLRHSLDAAGVPYDSYLDPNEGHELFKKRQTETLKFILAHIGNA